uniref:Pyrrolo-quinoline quinone n=1 Tax=Fervidobacterium nodosum TaxID=2424 RepID=A0A7C5Y7P2_9BACT
MLWKIITQGAIYSSATIDSTGNIIFASSDGYVYKLSETGRLIWKFKTGTETNSSPVLDETQ